MFHITEDVHLIETCIYKYKPEQSKKNTIFQSYCPVLIRSDLIPKGAISE